MTRISTSGPFAFQTTEDWSNGDWGDSTQYPGLFRYQNSTPVQQPRSAPRGPSSQDIGDARRMMDAQNLAKRVFQQGGQQQQGANRSAPQNVWDQAMPTMAQQMGDLTKDPAGLGRQMAGVGREIGSGLQAAADRMTEAGIGPLAPYSEKNPGPYNYMGPAMYGGESRENLEKRAMGPFSQFFGGQQPSFGGSSPTPYYYPQGGGMSVQNGVGAFAPWDMDIEKQKAMDVYKRQKWDQDGPMRAQMLQQYAPLWSQIFGGGGGGQYRAPNYRLNFGNQQASGPQPPQWG